MPRLFVAIDLPDEARAAIAAEQRRIMAKLDPRRRVTIVRTEHMHLTLVFIGEVDEARRAAIAEQMAHDIDQPAFDLVFGGIGVFPPRGAPRVLWLGVSRGSDLAIDLQHRVSARLQAAGVEPERRPFNPHLTIARWRESRPADAERVIEPAGGGTVATVRVTAVTLYESRLSSAGPTHMSLTHARLAGEGVGDT